MGLKFDSLREHCAMQSCSLEEQMVRRSSIIDAPKRLSVSLVSPNNNPQHDCDRHDHRIQCVERSEHRNILHLAGAHSNSALPLNFPISMTGGVGSLASSGFRITSPRPGS
jgi:hypothetical protein